MKKKRLKQEFMLFTTWLEERDYKPVKTILLNVMIIVLSGQEDDSGLIMAQAVAGKQPVDLVRNRDALTCCPISEIPGEIKVILERWIAALRDDVLLLGELYEEMADSRRIRGLYYTPVEIVEFILAHTVVAVDVTVNPNVKILDPACGSGIFLLKAYDLLFEKYCAARETLQQAYPSCAWTDDDIHRHIIEKNLWGADIDPQAAELATVSLLLKRPQIAQQTLSPHIILYDSLQYPQDGTPPDIMGFWSEKYDYVIGNPPYLSFGLRGAQTMDADYKAYLRQKYKASAEYKLSYYVLFIQRGLDMLQEKGQLGFIVPDSFLLGRYYSKIRQYIMDNACIQSIVHLSTEVFRSASTGYSVICILQKNSDQNARLAQNIKIFKGESVKSIPDISPVCCYEQQYFLHLPYNRFRIFFDIKVKELVDRIHSQSEPLNKYSTGHTGIRSLSRQSDIVSKQSNGPTWRRGLVSGSQISRYELRDEGDWINIDKDRLYGGGWNSSIVEQRKILIRQTGDTIIACMDDQALYHLNNIHSFVLQSLNQTVSLEYLLLILNSRFMAFYYHMISMEDGRSLAQLDIETLGLLPICVHDSINQQAPELVKIMTACSAGCLQDNPLQTKRAALDEYVDQLVYRIYDLTQEDIDRIEQYEASRKKRMVRIKAR